METNRLKKIIRKKLPWSKLENVYFVAKLPEIMVFFFFQSSWHPRSTNKKVQVQGLTQSWCLLSRCDRKKKGIWETRMLMEVIQIEGKKDNRTLLGENTRIRGPLWGIKGVGRWKEMVFISGSYWLSQT